MAILGYSKIQQTGDWLIDWLTNHRTIDDYNDMPTEHKYKYKYKYKIKTYNAPYVTRVIRRRGKWYFTRISYIFYRFTLCTSCVLSAFIKRILYCSPDVAVHSVQIWWVGLGAGRSNHCFTKCLTVIVNIVSCKQFLIVMLYLVKVNRQSGFGLHIHGCLPLIHTSHDTAYATKWPITRSEEKFIISKFDEIRIEIPK